MFARFALSVVVVLFLAADDADKDAKKELEKFQGDWTMVSLELAGTKADKEVVYKLTVKDDQWSVKAGEKASNDFTFKLDPSKDPKQIDMTRMINGNLQVSQGIYKLDGDTLTVCRGLPGRERPTEFKTTAGAGKTDGAGILATFKRETK